MSLPRWQHTVLIVEDDGDLRGLFADWLAFAGFRVQQAGDGLAALRLLETDTPNAVVLDLMLPTLNGLAVREEILAHAETWDIPIIVVTGAAEQFGPQLRLACVLRKPVTADLLIRTVRDSLRTT